MVRCGAKRPAERASERERERERDAADAAAKRLHVGEGAGRHPLGPPVPHCEYERKLSLQKVLYVKTLSDIFEKRKRCSPPPPMALASVLLICLITYDERLAGARAW